MGPTQGVLRPAWRTATRLITAEQWRFRARLVLGVGIAGNLLVGRRTCRRSCASLPVTPYR
jgi:hypothetical protein